MPFLMHIAFDNTKRLSKGVHYFEYAGVRFKLVQNNPRKWSDVLLTVTEDDDDEAQERAFRAAGEFLSALSWQNRCAIAFRYIGGHGSPANFLLRQARCRCFDFPEVPYHGAITGYGISRIAEITNEEQRIGLTLFREALSANKDLLAFLLYWQVMEVKTPDPVDWINKTVRRHPPGLNFDLDDMQLLPLRGRTLGQYLLDDCRHAIAHIRRKPGKCPLRFDDQADARRLAVSTRIVRSLAQHYIRTQLHVDSRLFLVRLRKGGFPVYVNELFMRTHPTVLVRAVPRRRPSV